MKAEDLLPAAMKRLREYIDDARCRGMQDAHAASLATATPREGLDESRASVASQNLSGHGRRAEGY